LIRKLFELFVFSHYFSSFKESVQVISGFKMKAPMLPIENEPHFTDYFKDNQADSPGGNVVFPPVKTEVKNCQDGCAEK
jgi:hypothetical protein